MTLRRLLRTARLSLLDMLDVILGRRDPMTPSRVRVDAVGGGDFREIGEHLASLVIGAGGLRPHERILDVGCGIGRVAVPLTRYLTSGQYIGFDVSAPAIHWCQSAISARHPNFSFMYVDVFSRHYNPKGRIHPSQFVFPVADASIDVAFLTSILTHLMPDTAAQYVAESSRVLRPGGRAVMTFFLLDDAVAEKSRHGQLVPTFATYPEPWWAIQDPRDPEGAVGVRVEVVEEALRARGLEIVEVSRGMWSGHEGAKTYQDLVVAVKSSAVR